MNSHSRRWLRLGQAAGRGAGTARQTWLPRQNRPLRGRPMVHGASDRPPLSTDPGTAHAEADPRLDASPDHLASRDTNGAGDADPAAGASPFVMPADSPAESHRIADPEPQGVPATRVDRLPF